MPSRVQQNSIPLRKISDFKSKLTGGGARPNLFEVELAFPNAVQIENDVLQKSRFLAKAAALPASTVAPVEVPFRGRILKIAGDRTFETWTITVINDVDFSIRTGMENWMGEIQERDSGVGATDLDYLVSRAFVSQLHRDESVLATYEFFNMYPSSIGSISLDMDTEEVQTYDITFTYSHFERTV